jgi:hypothetical protein
MPVPPPDRGLMPCSGEVGTIYGWAQQSISRILQQICSEQLIELFCIVLELLDFNCGFQMPRFPLRGNRR